ncbi:hypothetical protein B9Z55_020993 [Caenorhabditis nigoni]|nr:hypothetical protein B9Z55_020993 [Caenorhabditis nigoni]
MKLVCIHILLAIQNAESLSFVPPGFQQIISNSLNIPPQLFTEISPKCAQDTGFLMNSLSKSAKILETCDLESCPEKLTDHLFAIKQFDAFGKLPPGITQWTTVSDGSYKTCMEIDGLKYPTNYCYLMLILGKNTTCPQLSTLSHEMTDPENIIIKLGICIPESCSSKDIVHIFNSVSSLPFTACETFCVKKPQAIHTFSFWIFLFFITTVILVVFFGTILDYYLVDTDDKDFRFRILCCFSLYSNFKQIIRTKEVPRIKSADFLKFWSVVWVIIGHSPVNFLMGDTVKAMVEDRKKLATHLMLDAAYSVETFFVVSGTLLGYGLWKNTALVRSRMFWLKLLARRYIRLVPPLMVFIGIFVFSAPYFQGPVIASLFDNLEKQGDKCANTWWINFLMIQNFRKPSENCYAPSWYIAADFQCFLIAPLLVIPWMRSQKLGIKYSASLVAGSIFSTFFVFIAYSIPPSNYSLRGMEDYLTYVHQNGFLRIPTFLAGILLGKVLATQNGPSDFFRNNHGKIWLLCGIAIFQCFYGKLLAVTDFGEEEMGSLSSAIHHIFHRTLWTFIIIWVIYACQYDLTLLVTSFINHLIWQPLGRLTYCIYVIHWWMMIYVVLNQLDRSLHYVSMNQVLLTVSLPTVILCLPVALIWSSMFEVPIARIEKLLF